MRTGMFLLSLERMRLCDPYTGLDWQHFPVYLLFDLEKMGNNTDFFFYKMCSWCQQLPSSQDSTHHWSWKHIRPNANLWTRGQLPSLLIFCGLHRKTMANLRTYPPNKWNNYFYHLPTSNQKNLSTNGSAKDKTAPHTSPLLLRPGKQDPILFLQL